MLNCMFKINTTKIFIKNVFVENHFIKIVNSYYLSQVVLLNYILSSKEQMHQTVQNKQNNFNESTASRSQLTNGYITCQKNTEPFALKNVWNEKMGMK